MFLIRIRCSYLHALAPLLPGEEVRYPTDTGLIKSQNLFGHNGEKEASASAGRLTFSRPGLSQSLSRNLNPKLQNLKQNSLVCMCKLF